MWQVKLRDGTQFIGKRALRAYWYEGWFERGYRVTDSKDFPIGVIIIVPQRSIVYKIKV